MLPEPLLILAAVAVPFLAGAGLALTGALRTERATGPGVRATAVVAAGLGLTALIAAVVTDSTVDVSWIDALGVRFSLGTDGISAPLAIAAAAAALVATAVGRHSRGTGRSTAQQQGLVLLAASAGLTAVLTGDAVVLTIALQSSVVAVWALVQVGPEAGDSQGAAVGPAARAAATRLLLLSVAGSTLILGGVLTIVARTGTSSLEAWAMPGTVPAAGQTAVAALILLGLAALIPIWPLHTWAPATYAGATSGAAILLAGVVATASVHALIRLVVAPLPDGLGDLAPILAAAGVVGVLWAALAALVERDLARILGWLSIAHLGLVVLAIAAGSTTGLQVAVLGTLSHAAVLTLLLVVTGDLVGQWGSSDLAAVRAAVREAAPRLGFALLVGVAGAAAVPGLAGFWTQLGSVYAAWVPAQATRTEGWFRFFAVLAVLGIILLGCVAVRVLREVWSGDRTRPELVDLRLRRPHTAALLAPVVALLILVVIALGVYPIPVLDLTSDLVESIVGGQR